MNKLAVTNNQRENGAQAPQTPDRGPALTERLAALAEPVRLRLLRLLEKEELSVGEVAKIVQMPQSTVSRHLKVLSDSSWATRRASGTASYYRLNTGDLSEEASSLWRTVRDQMEDTATLREDRRRLDAVLADRRTDSLSFFGRVSGEWDAIRAELFGSGFTAQALPALLPPDAVVADLGCGTGNAAEHMAPFVKRVIAVDGSTPMLKAAEKRLEGFENIDFVEGDLLSLPLDDESVDAALCVLVAHHLDDPQRAINEMRRILRPGGVALIVDMFEHDRSIYRDTMGHRHMGFSRERIERMMGAAGFTDVRVTPLRSSAEAKGPGLFASSGRCEASGGRGIRTKE